MSWQHLGKKCVSIEQLQITLSALYDKLIVVASHIFAIIIIFYVQVDCACMYM